MLAVEESTQASYPAAAEDAVVMMNEEEDHLEGRVRVVTDPLRKLELQRLIEQCFMLDGINKYPFLLNRVIYFIFKYFFGDFS
jgi:hypothetical protein